MLKTDMAVIVEGKYDKIKLSSVIDGVIIETCGFGIFKNQEKCELIRKYALSKGIIILTDSDSAGFIIRNYIKGIVQGGKIINVYIPEIFGKEKRKLLPSKEGKLGVEGVDRDILLRAFEKAGVAFSENTGKPEITKSDLYVYGLSGHSNSSIRRKKLLEKLELPVLMSANAMLDVINSMFTKEQFEEELKKLD